MLGGTHVSPAAVVVLQSLDLIGGSRGWLEQYVGGVSWMPWYFELTDARYLECYADENKFEQLQVFDMLCAHVNERVRNYIYIYSKSFTLTNL